VDTHDPDDPYPWHGRYFGNISTLIFSLTLYPDIFDDRTSSISRLFREVRVEHFLIQKDGDLTQRPDIPGLTPRGFEQWATLMILANPERECERLAKAVLNMPISNPDDKKERFPKELPRRLFPKLADIATRERVEEHIMKHCGVDLPSITDAERNQATNPQPQTRRSPTISSSPIQRSHSYERGRPSRTASATTSVDPSTVGDEETLPPGPIERERKPYSAAPGGGKKYEDSGSFSSRPSASSESTPKPTRSDRDSLHAHDRFSRGSRSSSRSVHHRNGEYRHSESDLLRDREPRYAGLSAQDLPHVEYVESPVGEDEVRYHRRGGSRSEDVRHYWPEDSKGYRTGMLGGQGGSGHGYDKYYS
jgi:hypothetical protein